MSLLRRQSLVSLQKRYASSSIPTVPNFINGVFEQSKTTTWIDVLNPATQEVVCRVPQSTPEELQRAEVGAKAAFKAWKEVPIQQRQVSLFWFAGDNVNIIIET
jgi:malonate-semialdehyde dehydrogenase (acetylating)/methylmalonate-semialdehyde dehydrogenase